MALGMYDVPFLHLNAKRTPLAEVEPCVMDLLHPALTAVNVYDIPSQMATYCCSQFVVSAARLRTFPEKFWLAVWHALAHEADGGEQPELPKSCIAASERVDQNHHKHNN